jgi:hypothetical protein
MAGSRGRRGLLALSAITVSVPAVAIAQTISSSGEATPVGYCPSAKEAQDYWQATGQDLKPTARCIEQQEAVSSPGLSEPSADMGVPTASLSEAQLQEIYDPGDDPVVLVDKAGDGSAEVTMIALATPDALDPPPGSKLPPFAQADVQTLEDLRAYVREVEAERAQAAQP